MGVSASGLQRAALCCYLILSAGGRDAGWSSGSGADHPVPQSAGAFLFSVRKGLTFRSLIYFEFIFYIHGVRKWSSFILLHVAARFSQHNLLLSWGQD